MQKCNYLHGGGGSSLPAKLGIEDVSSPCHAELVSASVQRCELPVTLDRSRNRLARLAKNGTAKSVVFALCLCSLAQFGMTPTESVLCLVNRLSVKKCAFTMAEILLSLTIIGVVAAITLPSLTGNINERTWNTQRKALYARFSQAIPLMDSINGYGTVVEATSSASAIDTAAETFITGGLSKVMKINNICDSDHLEDCGVASRITTLQASQINVPKTMGELNDQMAISLSDSYNNYSLYDTKAAAFETANGESVILYYNPKCVGSLAETSEGYGGFRISPKICANFVYDLNGNKGPNTVGKDIGFITALYPSDVKVVAPYPAPRRLDDTYNQPEAVKACTAYDTEYRLPNIDELASMYINKNLLIDSSTSSLTVWSSTSISSTEVWGMSIIGGLTDDYEKESHSYYAWCVKR